MIVIVLISFIILYTFNHMGESERAKEVFNGIAFIIALLALCIFTLYWVKGLVTAL